MGLRGPKPKGAAHAVMTGNYRPGRHGPRAKPAAAPQPSEISEAEQTARRAEIEAQRRAIYGEHPLDPGPRSGGSARRIRW